MRVLVLAVAMVAALVACQPPAGSAPSTTPTPTPTPVLAANPTSNPAPSSPSPSTATEPAPATTTPPATPPSPLPSATTVLRAAVALEPSGANVPLQAAETVVDPGATFRVELAATLTDVRVVLLDRADAIVPASETREVGAATTLTLAPAAPLVPASRYTLRVDGARERELHDDAGHAFAPVTLPILVAGEAPKAEPKKAATKTKKKRHR